MYICIQYICVYIYICIYTYIYINIIIYIYRDTRMNKPKLPSTFFTLKGLHGMFMVTRISTTV